MKSLYASGLIVVAMHVTSATSAQQDATSQAALPMFEVASVRPSAVRAGEQLYIQGGEFLPGGRFLAQNSELQTIIRRAFPEFVRPEYIDVPAWVRTERFDVDARAGRDAPEAELRLMLRRLLAERFAFKARVEARAVDGYALVLANPARGPGAGMRKVTRTCRTGVAAAATVNGTTVEISVDERDSLPCVYTSRITDGLQIDEFSARPMSHVAFILQNRVGRPVVDQTGLAGQFDIRLESSPNPASTASDAVPKGASLFTALKEQLGLELKATKVSVDFLVIDSIQRPLPN